MLSNTIFKKDHRTVVECSKCKFLYAAAFDELELIRLYKREYYTSKDDPKIQEWIDRNCNIWLELAKEIKNKLPTKCCLLDVGAGTGGFLCAINEVMPEVSLDAIESSREAVESIKERIPIVQFPAETFDAMSRNYEKKYTIITMLQCLEHITNPLEYLKIANSLLEDDGYLLITVPNRYTYRALIKKYDEPLCFGNQTHLQFFSIHSIENILKEAGFKKFKRVASFGGTHKNILTSGIQYIFRILGFSSELKYLAQK